MQARRPKQIAPCRGQWIICASCAVRLSVSTAFWLHGAERHQQKLGHEVDLHFGDLPGRCEGAEPRRLRLYGGLCGRSLASQSDQIGNSRQRCPCSLAVGPFGWYLAMHVGCGNASGARFRQQVCECLSSQGAKPVWVVAPQGQRLEEITPGEQEMRTGVL